MFVKWNRLQGLMTHTTRKVFFFLIVAIVGMYTYSNWWVPTDKRTETQIFETLLHTLHEKRDAIIPLMKGLSMPFLDACVNFEQSVRNRNPSDAKIYREKLRTILKEDLAKQDVEPVKTKFRTESKQLLELTKKIIQTLERIHAKRA